MFSKIDVSKDTFLPLKIHQMLVSQFPQKMLPFYPFSLSQKVMQFHEKFKIKQNGKCELFELFFNNLCRRWSNFLTILMFHHQKGIIYEETDRNIKTGLFGLRLKNINFFFVNLKVIFYLLIRNSILTGSKSSSKDILTF